MTVGRPVGNTCVHLLDADLLPVPVGMVGELCIGGLGLARGYADRPGQTAERFVPDPFGCRPGGRLYRTGDLARYDAHGRLYVLGRADSQVKIRGFRIELGEVEAALARHPAVRAAVATARAEHSGELRLDAYAVPEPGPGPTVAQLRGFLRERLPAAMVPSRIAIVGELPVTANGKVDRAALPEIHVETLGPAGPNLPAATRLERLIADVWRQVLNVSELGTADNFFDLGGHSVLLVAVAGRLAEELGRPVTPLTVLEHPTVAALARHLGQDGEPGPTAEEAAGKEAPAAGRNRLRQRRERIGESI